MKIQTTTGVARVFIIQNKETLETHVLALNGEYEITTFTTKFTCPPGCYFEKMDREFILKQTAHEIADLQDKIEELQEEAEILQLNLDCYREKPVA